jgi:hypothetical protein
MKEAAIQILQRLANGVNPVTGEIFAADSPYNEPAIIRALFFVLEQMQSPRANLPENHGRPWAAEEKLFVANAYREGAALIHIAKALKRTRGSIRSELIRQGLFISEPETAPEITPAKIAIAKQIISTIGCIRSGEENARN